MERSRNSRRTFDARSCAHANCDRSNVCGTSSSETHESEREERDPYYQNVRSAQTQPFLVGFLGERIFVSAMELAITIEKPI